MLDRAAIAARIPHAGDMCLLDRVINWDQQGIRCATATHRDPHNPLREPRGLPVWTGIEYAAQASAVHGALVHPLHVPRAGVLAALRNVSVNCEWLHQIEEDLVVAATLLHSDLAGGIYSFEVSAGANWLLRGQSTFMYTQER